MAKIEVHIPTELSRKEVLKLVSHAIDLPRIAKKLKISEEMLKKHYEDEINLGSIEADATMTNALYQAGIGGSVRAMEIWLKCRTGNWDEKQTTRLIGDDDKPAIQVVFTNSTKPRSTKELGEDEAE